VHASLGALQLLGGRAARLDRQAVQQRAGRRRLDHAVQPEPDQRDARGLDTGPDRDDGLGDVVGQRPDDQRQRDPSPVPGHAALLTAASMPAVGSPTGPCT